MLLDRLTSFRFMTTIKSTMPVDKVWKLHTLAIQFCTPRIAPYNFGIFCMCLAHP